VHIWQFSAAHDSLTYELLASSLLAVLPAVSRLGTFATMWPNRTLATEQISCEYGSNKTALFATL
jgi:hypothetical protein